ncbi:hypothetical protein Nepgr_023304 [Nepenthes gracilis]|uniref:Uncharacterized protein n=1 Tax=Nepenthes gracilis TaxID=150966 RepID=A0AAD3XXL2_NEPGR|nr:hypothetical protein Nepgr_023304 [Nepenthes gracilis]
MAPRPLQAEAGREPKEVPKRFTIEARKIPMLTDEVKLNSFISTLGPGDFFKHLVHKDPQTFREIQSIIQAYIVTKQTNEVKHPE